MTQKKSSEKLIRDIKRNTRRKYSAEENLQTGRKNKGMKILENLLGFLKENKRASGIWPQIEVLTAMGETEEALQKLE